MFAIRTATVADVPAITRHRAEMFSDMGVLSTEAYPILVREATAALTAGLARGEYLGWLATTGDPEAIIGGAGVQLRQVLPFPRHRSGEVTIAAGRQAIVLNVYTEPPWRRRGVARRLMEAVLTWAKEAELESLVLHASNQGRSLYEQLGFVATNEMRFTHL